MNHSAYLERREQIETYFDRTAAKAWERLTSNAPLGRIRASVRAGRDQMRNTLLDWLPEDMRGLRLLDAGCGTGALAVERLAERTSASLLFTFAPRTPLLAAMHSVGRLFPRSDRSPALTPAAEPVLRTGLLAAIGAQGWSEGRSERVASGFYTSQAWEWER